MILFKSQKRGWLRGHIVDEVWSILLKARAKTSASTILLLGSSRLAPDIDLEDEPRNRGQGWTANHTLFL